MTTYESALSELSGRLIGTGSNLTNSLSEILAAALQELIEAELTAAIGAAPGERTEDRLAYRTRHSTTGPGRRPEAGGSRRACTAWVAWQPTPISTGRPTPDTRACHHELRHCGAARVTPSMVTGRSPERLLAPRSSSLAAGQSPRVQQTTSNGLRVRPVPSAAFHHHGGTNAYRRPGDTSTAAAAASLVIPVAICFQNSRSTSRRSDGAPGDFIGDRPVNSFIHPAGLPINTSIIEVLRPPVESALGAVVGVDHDSAGGVGVAVGDRNAERVGDQGGVVSDQGNPSSAIIENRHGVGVLVGGW